MWTTGSLLSKNTLLGLCVYYYDEQITINWQDVVKSVADGLKQSRAELQLKQRSRRHQRFYGDGCRAGWSEQGGANMADTENCNDASLQMYDSG